MAKKNKKPSKKEIEAVLKNPPNVVKAIIEAKSRLEEPLKIKGSLNDVLLASVGKYKKPEETN
jgi:hypothetical protein